MSVLVTGGTGFIGSHTVVELIQAGEQVVIVGDNKKLDVPKRFTADFKAIRDNDEQLAAVIAGKLILNNIRAFDAENGKTYTFDFDMVE